MIATTKAALASNLRRARRAAGLTQQQLAQRTGIAQSDISAYETGRVEPRHRNLRKIAKALGVEPGSLL